VPNLLDVGTKEWGALQGHGLIVGIPGIFYVADTVDLASLPTAQMPTYTVLSRRIPRAKVLDVFVSTYVPDREASVGAPLCNKLISSVFDRQPAALLDSRTLLSVARRVFASLPDGRLILLRTKATANDFTTSLAPTPGSVP
jgi:hypothetical protein